MSIAYTIAKDIYSHPDKWKYSEFYLWRSMGPFLLKVSLFCEKPYVLLIDGPDRSKLSLQANWIEKLLLWRASKKWLHNQHIGLVLAMTDNLTMAEWISRRENEIAKRKTVEN